jgi:hypothetical protein
MTTPTPTNEPIQLWKISFKRLPNDDSLVKYSVRAENGEVFTDTAVIRDLVDGMEGWSALREVFFAELRSAMIMGHEYTATIRSTRTGLRMVDLLPRLRAGR